MWRYIGWLLGVDEKWLAATERDGVRKLYHTFLTHRLADEKIGQLGRSLQQEPWQRTLPSHHMSPMQEKAYRFFLYQQHLSNSSLILAPRQRQQLGIPFYVLPWYPALSAPWRLLKLSWLRLRGERAKRAYAQRIRAEQIRHLDSASPSITI